MTDTQDKKPIEEMTFEEKTYAYARAWAQMNRRDFLKAGAALGGSAAFAGLSIPSASAAKRGARSASRAGRNPTPSTRRRPRFSSPTRSHGRSTIR